MTEDPSKRIGDYEVLGILGSGGMGKVFKVRNVISDRIEAMKILLPDLEGRQELADRFLREIKLLASLDHPNIAQLRTALTLSNRLVMVMEYVEGTTLAARLEQGPIPANEALGYVAQVLGALSYAHSRNVIHRDIKPANMMHTSNGMVKLMDFGIARAAGDPTMTVTGTTIGSLFYMSPEQVKGGAVDARSDLYSLGISLYEMVTGQLPFKAGSDYSLMTAQLQERPKPPSELRPELPPQLNGIILHSMAKEPAERFQSADEFREALEAIRQTLPAPAAVVSMAAVAPLRPVPASTSPLGEPPITAATSVFSGSSTLGSSPTASQISSAPVPAPQAQVPSVMDLSPKPSKGRGLYMALGAAVVLLVLVLAGISLPRLLKTRANEQKQADQSSSGQSSTAPPSSTPTPPTTPDANNSNANTSTPSSDSNSGSAAADSSKPADAGVQPSTDAGSNGAQPSGSTSASAGNAGGTPAADSASSSMTASKSKGKSASSKRGKSKISDGAGSTANQTAASATSDQGNTGASAQKAEPMEELEQDVDQTSSRATAANDSLDTMRRQLSGQGLNLRGDIASSQELMKANLEHARQALQNHDARAAKRYLNLAQANMDKIEKFLGH